MGRRRRAIVSAPTQLVGYVRVSTQEQAQSGLGLEAQRASLAAYAGLYKLDVGEVLVDDGFSAKNLKRPAMQELLRRLDARETAGVVVAKLDRLTRSIRDISMLVDRFFREGQLRLVSVGEQIDTTSAGGRLVLNVLTSVAEWEREAIGERTKAALQAKRARGERAGQVPIGYKADGQQLVEDEQQQEAMKLLRELSSTGLTLRAIAAELEAGGFGRWPVTRVWRVLQKETET